MAQRINEVIEEQLRQIVKVKVAELYDRFYQNSREMVVGIPMNNIPYNAIINTKIIMDYEIPKVLHFPPAILVPIQHFMTAALKRVSQH